MECKLTVIVQIDGCRNDYFNENSTPFLFLLKQEGISGSLVPTFGFEPDAAYLAGLYPDECNGGMHFWYSPETSPFRNVKFLIKHFDRFPNIFQNNFRRILNLFVRKWSNSSRVRCMPSFYKIPFSLMPFFDLSERYLLYEDKFVQGRSIFTILKNNNRPFFFHGAPTCPTGLKDVYQGLIEATHPFDFIFLHISVLDAIGHKYGPFSNELLSNLGEVDRFIKEIWTFLKKKYGEFNFMIIGDHGMVEVKEVLDIKARIDKLGLKIGKDYIYFLDSTFARFWFFSENSKQLVISILTKIEQGHILSKQEKNKYHLNYSHNKFGDLIFVVNPGVLVFPNFWNNIIPEKGMHGYIPENNGQQSAFTIRSPLIRGQKKVEKSVDMRRVFPTLLKFTGLISYNTSYKLNSIV